jgi:hypothetical protein
MCKCAKGAFNDDYSRELLRAIGDWKVDGPVTSDEEVKKHYARQESLEIWHY